MLMAMPGVTILEPRDYVSLRQMLLYAADECTGPVFIRYPRGVGQCPSAYRAGARGRLAPPLPRAEVVYAGSDVTVVSCGNMTGFAVQAALQLAEEGISCEVVDCRSAKPLDLPTILASVASTRALLVWEEVCPSGSIGSEIALALLNEKRNIPFRHLHVGDHPVSQATQNEAWAAEGLDVEACVQAARELYQEKHRTEARFAAEMR
jgi:deoxyxylulose-5-phosphate synthase